MLPVHADETEDTASDFAALTGEGLATALSDDKVIGWSQWEAAARQGRPWKEVAHWPKVRGPHDLTLLHLAARWGRQDWLAPLLQTWPLSVKDESGRTPVHEAAWAGHLDILRKLPWTPALLNEPDRQGWRPLHLALFNQRWQVARWLLQQGVSAEGLTSEGWSPVMLAIMQPGGCRLLPDLRRAGARMTGQLSLGGRHYSLRQLAQSLNRKKCLEYLSE